MMANFSSTACEQCAGELVSFKEGSVCGSKCLACGWSLVTTDISGIKFDETNYEIFCVGDYKDKAHVTCVSKASGFGFLKSRENLCQGEFVVFCGKAVDILKIRDELVVAGLRCSIKPDFIWGG
ncbi:hypothetical protein [Pseudomonas vanderleydeniana]|uniref:Uncharacterized protein n=1 Tax=Pseudomonas vanderleydeniana TaxID=2745495 RepID=A0A9E6TUD2_9PSED|nr:hypothetical protein [Pseudomonas vanderleydeniana]QXI30702.1 hypothetical protein HU752_012470 [Pseudomonas vanderleydeniana]